ncbi:MAG: hypothetical protein WCT49_01935 [Candidatus Paceibacterota bacterium]|jgi:hypothetical protein|nr:hypothetical protein [Candidatus Paceibacterota bacterium]
MKTNIPETISEQLERNLDTLHLLDHSLVVEQECYPTGGITEEDGRVQSKMRVSVTRSEMAYPIRLPNGEDQRTEDATSRYQAVINHAIDKEAVRSFKRSLLAAHIARMSDWAQGYLEAKYSNNPKMRDSERDFAAEQAAYFQCQIKRAHRLVECIDSGELHVRYEFIDVGLCCEDLHLMLIAAR